MIGQSIIKQSIEDVEPISNINMVVALKPYPNISLFATYAPTAYTTGSRPRPGKENREHYNGLDRIVRETEQEGIVIIGGDTNARVQTTTGAEYYG